MIALLSSLANALGPGRAYLQNLRAEFAVAYSGANFHPWPDGCDCADNLSALVRRDAVPALQRRVWPEHAQNPFDAAETVPCVLE